MQLEHRERDVTGPSPPLTPPRRPAAVPGFPFLPTPRPARELVVAWGGRAVPSRDQPLALRAQVLVAQPGFLLAPGCRPSAGFISYF